MSCSLWLVTNFIGLYNETKRGKVVFFAEDTVDSDQCLLVPQFQYRASSLHIVRVVAVHYLLAIIHKVEARYCVKLPNMLQFIAIFITGLNIPHRVGLAESASFIVLMYRTFLLEDRRSNAIRKHATNGRQDRCAAL